MSEEFDSRKDWHSTKFEQRPRIFVELSAFVKLSGWRPLIIWPFHLLKVGQKQKGRSWVHETPILEVISVTLTLNPYVVINDTQGVIGTHFHLRHLHWNYPGIFTYWWRSLLIATSKFDFLDIRRHSATQITHFYILHWQVRAEKPSFNQPNRERWGARLIDIIEHLPHKLFLLWYHH